jgi:hypothetical protein
MPDYGRPVRFGIFPSPEAAKLEHTLAPVAIADHAGLELAGIEDDPYQAAYPIAAARVGTEGARTGRRGGSDS